MAVKAGESTNGLTERGGSRARVAHAVVATDALPERSEQAREDEGGLDRFQAPHNLSVALRQKLETSLPSTFLFLVQQPFCESACIAVAASRAT